MFRTLRSKLIASHVLLVVLLLLLAGIAAGLLVTRALRQQSLARARNATIALAQRLRQPPGARPGELFERLKRESARMGGRVLILNSQGHIVVDSGETYIGQRIPPPRSPIPERPVIRRLTMPDGKEYFVIVVDLNLQLQGRQARYLALAVEIKEVDPPWRTLLLPLGLIGLVTIALAVGLAFLMSHSIAHPIERMTVAAAEIAQGHYDQEIPVKGDDEIARLAQTFTHMAQEVARTQRTQRDFLANVSHDLRTPLTSIQGFSQAMLEGAITDAAGYRRAAEIIKGEADRMARLVADLLELARLEGRQLDLAPEPVSLSQILRSEVLKVAARAEEAGLQVQLSLPDDLPRIVADGNRVEQAIANLVDNAVKYAKPHTTIQITAGRWHGDGTRPTPLSVACGQPPAAGDWVTVEVSNRGEPIPATDLERIFERFYRADKSRRRAEGSGLGLAIVRETVLAHGGYIEVSSDGDGADGETRFRVWLPVTQAEQHKGQSP